MRVCIPIEFRAHGGGFYFLQAFEEFLLSEGHFVTRRVADQYDVLFTNHWMTPHREIIRAFRFNPDVRIIQRIDGAAQDYGRNPEADRRQRKINFLADLTIFQSEYSRYSTREKYPVIANDGPVIYNPVDTQLFNPYGESRSFQPYAQLVACVTWSTNPMKGSSHVYAAAASNPDIGFVLCGQFPDAPKLPNLFPLGILSRMKLSIALRSCKMLLTFSKNEACPNHVLEALASGLPVLYDDSGAIREIVADCGLPATVQNFHDQYSLISKKLDQYSESARHRAQTYFSPQKIFPKYMNALFAALNTPARTSRFKRRLLSFV
jgi:glycosyltransferase involved in cell wall biosynthesis